MKIPIDNFNISLLLQNKISDWQIKNDTTEIYSVYYKKSFIIQIGKHLPKKLQYKIIKAIVRNKELL